MTNDPVGRLVRNLFDLQRIANGVSVDLEARQQALFEQIVADLRRIDPTGPSAARYRRMRVDKFLRAVDRRLREFRPIMDTTLRDHLAVIGRQQALYAQQTLAFSLADAASMIRPTTISQALIRSILNVDPFQGRLLSEHVARYRPAVLDRIRIETREGMANEESIPDIVRRIRGTQSGYIRKDPKTGAFVPKGTPGAIVQPRYLGGVLRKTTRGTEALVRTAVQTVANAAMAQTYEDNAAILSGILFVAALDDRTTEICLALDGEVWPIGSDDIQVPPLHWNCRSVLAPEIDWEGVGLPEPPEGWRVVRDMSTVDPEDLDRRVSARRRTGDFGKQQRVRSSVTATEWLRGQPAYVQDKMLGRGRAELFRAGKVSLKDLVRDDNSTVPLAELRERIAV